MIFFNLSFRELRRCDLIEHLEWINLVRCNFSAEIAKCAQLYMVVEVYKYEYACCNHQEPIIKFWIVSLRPLCDTVASA